MHFLLENGAISSRAEGVVMRYGLSRREFVIGAAAAGVVATGWPLPAYVRAESQQWADLAGRFVFDGRAPVRKKLKVDKDVPCCGKCDIRDESLMVVKNAGLANVFVYVRSKSVDIHPDLEHVAGGRITLDNRDCIFQPHCFTIWYPRQDFYTINSDPVAQNIAFDPPGDVPCNIVLPVKGDGTYKFSRKQNVPITIHCNYHPWESGYILPRDNPYAAISGPDGEFHISKLPVGAELEFQAWQERVGYLNTPDWPKGRFKATIKPGINDLGSIKLAAALFDK